MSAFEYKAARFEYKFTETGAETKGSFEGYGSVFNKMDDGGDMIMPGAFASTLAEHQNAGTMPQMLLNHGGLANMMPMPSPEDLLPIGRWKSMSEDANGLQCKGQLINLDTESGKRIYGAMKEGALSGLSMGYKATNFTRGTKASEPARTIREVKLFELGPVTFPMQGAAMIASCKSIDFSNLKGAEGFLRDACGLSRAEAKAFIACFKNLNLRDAGEDDEAKKVIAALSRKVELFKP